MKVKPATPPAFKPYAPAKHMRLAEINEAQPSVSTLKDVGAGYTRSWGGQEGNR